ncbi:MAG: hypothetical protein HQK58_00335 [Deltaproteobacteria bacterium]|nr:hypothetical protein [Deltaproteobacteria bacterium]
MKTASKLLIVVMSLCATVAMAQDRPPEPSPRGAGPPPLGLQPRDDRRGQQPRDDRQRYSIEQAISDQAQLHTIAFNGLAFLTGDFGSSTFIPPGKVSDFFGFQYMRDIDAAGKGHNPMFLDRIAGNVLRILSEDQRRRFYEAAREQELLMKNIALKRFPLIAAFHKQLVGNTGLNREAVMAYCADLFALDATLAFRRAKVFGELVRSFTAEQKRNLGRLKFGDFNTWPDVDREEVRRLLPRGSSKLVSVGYMTLASEFFSWYAGSIEADTYFCPERHGTYFGGFYLKDMPAMGRRDYDISTSLTGDSGATFLNVLDTSQRSRLTDVLDRQRKTLRDIVEVRRTISTRLRGFLRGEIPAEQEIVTLGKRYGRLDGELAYEYATAFASTYKTMDAGQKESIRSLRHTQTNEKGTAFLYSDRIPMPNIPDSAFLSD